MVNGSAESAGCCVGDTVTRKECCPQVGGLLLLTSGVGRQEIVDGDEASVTERPVDHGQTP
jgi:hypothetical protein